MKSNPIFVFAKWQVKDGHLETVLNLLKEVAAKSTAEKGNLHYIVHQNNTDPNGIVLYEGYADEAALNEHRNAEHFQNLVVGKIVPLLANREVILTSKIQS